MSVCSSVTSVNGNIMPTPALLTNKSIGQDCSTTALVPFQLPRSTFIVSIDGNSFFKFSVKMNTFYTDLSINFNLAVNVEGLIKITPFFMFMLLCK